MAYNISKPNRATIIQLHLEKIKKKKLESVLDRPLETLTLEANSEIPVQNGLPSPMFHVSHSKTSKSLNYKFWL